MFTPRSSSTAGHCDPRHRTCRGTADVQRAIASISTHQHRPEVASTRHILTANIHKSEISFVSSAGLESILRPVFDASELAVRPDVSQRPHRARSGRPSRPVGHTVPPTRRYQSKPLLPVLSRLRMVAPAASAPRTTPAPGTSTPGCDGREVTRAAIFVSISASKFPSGKSFIPAQGARHTSTQPLD